MKKFRFEYRITLAYLLAGVLWILFSDQAINNLIDDRQLLSNAQTYKGWFYVLITAVLFFLFLKFSSGNFE
jgi:choline-glycine betaine transporter